MCFLLYLFLKFFPCSLQMLAIISVQGLFYYFCCVILPILLIFLMRCLSFIRPSGQNQCPCPMKGVLVDTSHRDHLWLIRMADVLESQLYKYCWWIGDVYIQSNLECELVLLSKVNNLSVGWDSLYVSCKLRFCLNSLSALIAFSLSSLAGALSSGSSVMLVP